MNWSKLLKEEYQKPYFSKLMERLRADRIAGHKIYPHQKDRLRALALTPFDKVKAVIIGQDPYHGPGQADGLSFSVRPDQPIPPSLQNIFKELSTDAKLPTPKTGSLVKWAKQGVLLLNTSLTVLEGKPNSHSRIGWQFLTDRIIEELAKNPNVIFVLWGRSAHSKIKLIECTDNILVAAHPSPLSADRGFFGCRHFTRINFRLRKAGIDPIDWTL